MAYVEYCTSTTHNTKQQRCPVSPSTAVCTVHGTECEHAYNLFEVILDLGRCLFVVGSKQ